MSENWFCKICLLQFDKQYVFDLHLSLVHGEKIEVKVELPLYEENLQESRITEKEFSYQSLDKRADPPGMGYIVKYTWLVTLLLTLKYPLYLNIDGSVLGYDSTKLCENIVSRMHSRTFHSTWRNPKCILGFSTLCLRPMPLLI